MDLKLILKKRISDIILVIAVFLVFFLTGKDKLGGTNVNISETNSNPAPLDSDNQLLKDNIDPVRAPILLPADINNQARIEPNNHANQNILIDNQNPPSIKENPNRDVVPLSQIFPKTNSENSLENSKNEKNSGSNPLADSLNTLKAKEASQDDLIDRNAYFRKLSEQMNQLQGSASTDSVGTEDTERSNPIKINPSEEGGDLEGLADLPIITDENFDDFDNPNFPLDPYNELNERFPQPPIVE